MQLVIHKNNRIDILDAIRGAAIISMVFYHALYDIDDIFGYRIPILDTLFFEIIRQPFTWAFILLAGVSSRFSHNNIKRGARVLFLGLIITVATVIFIPSQSIYFGILHFMGCAILLFELVKPVCDRIPATAAFVIWSVLFAITFTMPDTHFIGFPGLCGFALPEVLRNTPHIYALGFPDDNFFSADYFPMIPWFFMFLVGTVAGIPIKNHCLPEKFYTVRVPFLAAAGRNTLLIYVLHQPIVYGLLYLSFKLLHL